MSRENVEVVRQLMETLAGEDPESALELLDPEVEFDQTARPDGEVWHGHEGVRRAMTQWISAFDDWSIEVDRYVDVGADRALVLWRERGRSRDTGLQLAQRGGTVYTVAGGRIVKMVAYLGHEEALEAVGLSE
jgi:ketosteroid isomerase-like protein